MIRWSHEQGIRFHGANHSNFSQTSKKSKVCPVNLGVLSFSILQSTYSFSHHFSICFDVKFSRKQLNIIRGHPTRKNRERLRMQFSAFSYRFMAF